MKCAILVRLIEEVITCLWEGEGEGRRERERERERERD